MRKRPLGRYLPSALLLLIVLASGFVAQQPRNRPASQAAPVNNLKITYRTTTSGQSMESTTMIRGARERSEMKLGYGMEMVSITQCDLKRTIQLSEKTRKYVITPMETGTTSSSAGASPTTGVATPTTRGGLVTYTTTATDTGERREMFGFTARHVKSTLSIQSSPDACNATNMRMETDGWYIDLTVGFSCELGRTQMAAPQMPQGGCRDRYQFKNVGSGRKGYPLIETTTMYGPEGRVMSSSTKEVVDLSRDSLDPALFDVPAGYTETANSQELYAIPSMGEAMGQPAPSRVPASDRPAASSSSGMKAPGSIRVGVVQINNRSGKEVSAESLRSRLIGEIQGANIEAVPLNAISQMEAEMECKTKQCDFILHTDITAMKASKVGGMFGKVAGVGGLGKTETKVEFKLFALGNTAALLQSSATAKEEGDDVSAGAALAQEARLVSAEVRRRKP